MDIPLTHRMIQIYYPGSINFLSQPKKNEDDIRQNLMKKGARKPQISPLKALQVFPICGIARVFGSIAFKGAKWIG